MPAATEVVQHHITEFLQNASQVSGWGMIVLLFLSFILMSAIDRAINDIFKVVRRRRFIVTFMTYWTLITLGPILIASSLLFGDSFFEITVAEIETAETVRSYAIDLLSVVSAFLMFFFLYTVTPYCKVPVRHALVWARVAWFMFEITKYGFGVYVLYIPMYFVVYGTLGVVPILFIWIYIIWMVVLIGAEITHFLMEYDQEKE